MAWTCTVLHLGPGACYKWPRGNHSEPPIFKVVVSLLRCCKASTGLPLYLWEPRHLTQPGKSLDQSITLSHPLEGVPSQRQTHWQKNGFPPSPPGRANTGAEKDHRVWPRTQLAFLEASIYSGPNIWGQTNAFRLKMLNLDKNVNKIVICVHGILKG